MFFTITLHKEYITGSHTNYAYLFSEQAAGIPETFWASIIIPSGKGLRFYTLDGLTELKREIATIDVPNKKIEAWIKIPAEISSASDYIIKVNTEGASKENDNDVFNDDRVLHFSVNDYTGANNTLDSSPNQRVCHTRDASIVTGKIGSAFYFNKSALQFVEVGNEPDFSKAFSMSFWISPVNVNSENNNFIAKETYDQYEYLVGAWNADAVLYVAWKASGQPWEFPPYNNHITFGYQKIAITFDGVDTMRFYRNNFLDKIYTITHKPTHYTCGLVLAGTLVGTDPANRHALQGEIDEFRFVNGIIRSLDYYTTAYNNENNPVAFSSMAEIATNSSKIHYAVEIFANSDDTWASLTSVPYGIKNGVFRFVTDRPKYDGSTVIPHYGHEEIDQSGAYVSDAAITDPYKEGMLQKESFTSNPTRTVDITATGSYSTESSFSFKIRNDILFWNFCQANGINLTGRKIIMWVSINDIFYQCARGRVSNNPYDEQDYTFDVIDDANIIHKMIPPLIATQTGLKDAPLSDNGEAVPLVMGDVPKSKILKLESKNSIIVPAVAADSYTIIASDENGTKAKINLFMKGYIANDPRLVGKYINVTSGGHANTDLVYKITGNDASTNDPLLFRDDLLDFNTTMIYIEALLTDDNNLIVLESTFNTIYVYGMYAHPLDGDTYPHANTDTWWFVISSFSVDTVISNKATKSTNGLWAYDDASKQYLDVRTLLQVSSSANKITLTSNTASVDGKVNKIDDLGQTLKEFGVRVNPPSIADDPYFGPYNAVSPDGGVVFREPELIAKVQDKNRLTGWLVPYTFPRPTFASSDVYYVYAKYKISHLAIDYDRIFFLADVDIRDALGANVDCKYGGLKYAIYDKNGRVILTGAEGSRVPYMENGLGFGARSQHIGNTFKKKNFIPNDYYTPANIIGDNVSIFNADTADGAHQWSNILEMSKDHIDYFKNKDVMWIEFCIGFASFVHTVFGRWRGFQIKIKELSILGMRQVDTISGALYTSVTGELTGPTSGPTPPDRSHETNDVYHTFIHILEDYDGIPHQLIDYGNLAATRSGYDALGLAGWHVGRVLTDRKNSIDYLNELCSHSFVAMFPTRQGRRGLRSFQNFNQVNTPVATHDANIICRDSIEGFEKTDIAQLYNNLVLRYSYDPALQKFVRAFYVANVDKLSIFPPVNDYDPDPTFTPVVSTTSLLIGDGLKTLIVDAGLNFLTGNNVTIKYDDANFMNGIVQTYDIATGQLDVLIETMVGSGTYTTWSVFVAGNPTWYQCFGGLEGSPDFSSAGYAESKIIWDMCRHSYFTNRIVKQNQNDTSQLSWFVDRALFDPATVWGTGDKSSAYYYMQLLAQWMTLQKYVVTYSIPINKDTISIELLDIINFNDKIYTNSEDVVGRIVSIETNAAEDKLRIQSILQPLELRPYPIPVTTSRKHLISPLGVPFTQGSQLL